MRRSERAAAQVDVTGQSVLGSHFGPPLRRNPLLERLDVDRLSDREDPLRGNAQPCQIIPALLAVDDVHVGRAMEQPPQPALAGRQVAFRVASSLEPHEQPAAEYQRI